MKNLCALLMSSLYDCSCIRCYYYFRDSQALLNGISNSLSKYISRGSATFHRLRKSKDKVRTSGKHTQDQDVCNSQLQILKSSRKSGWPRE